MLKIQGQITEIKWVIQIEGQDEPKGILSTKKLPGGRGCL